MYEKKNQKFGIQWPLVIVFLAAENEKRQLKD